MMGVFKGISGLAGMATGSNKKANDLAKRTKTSPADVVRWLHSPTALRAAERILVIQISWSGCKDTQTSADTSEAGQATGAMSWVRPAARSGCSPDDPALQAFIESLCAYRVLHVAPPTIR